jgi:hypothetical protein
MYDQVLGEKNQKPTFKPENKVFFCKLFASGLSVAS